MTLTRFLTEYVYNPIALALARRRAARGLRGVAGPRTTAAAFTTLVAAPTIATMFLSGLWHGAGNQFLVFGLLHGFYLTVCHAWRLWRPRFWPHAESYRRIMGPFGLALTFCAAAVALAFFRADDVAAGGNILAGMAGLHGVALPDAIAARLPGLAGALSALGARFQPGNLAALFAAYAWIAALLAVALLAPNLLQLMRAEQPALTLPAPYAPATRLGRLLAWTPSPAWAVATALAALCGILTLGDVSEFLYWQF